MALESDIKKMLKSQKPRPQKWTKEEKNTLLEFKRAGVHWRSIVNEKDVMKKYFSHRSPPAIENKYYDL